jgi:hypothetical protein
VVALAMRVRLIPAVAVAVVLGNLAMAVLAVLALLYFAFLIRFLLVFQEA